MGFSGALPEYWDLVDVDGHRTGGVHAREQGSLPEGLFHLVATVCVARPDGTVLLQQRAVGREFELKWEFSGGSAITGETSAQACLRELREEAGICVLEEKLALVGRHAEGSAPVDLYLARVPQDVSIVIDPAEVNDFDWGPLHRVEELLSEGSMAEPWVDRLGALGPSLANTIGPACR
ncbi:NUDIX hydrolase [Actinomycetaceae bacterium MB13-C1-2]|nr:NUDIX hydrolase [Actinomycetaceae bacterium MB13-C1-2]